MRISYVSDGVPVLLLTISEALVLDELLSAHCWFFFSEGSRFAAFGLATTASANGLDQVKRSLLQSSPVILKMLLSASLMLSLERLPLMVVAS